MRISDSPYSVRETMDRAVSTLRARDIERFARVDHAGGAREAGLELPDEELLIFGDPRVGTMLMQTDPRVGYELPLRLLIWSEGGQTKVAYRQPRDLADTYDLAAQVEVLERMGSLLERIVAEVTAPGD